MCCEHFATSFSRDFFFLELRWFGSHISPSQHDKSVVMTHSTIIQTSACADTEYVTEFARKRNPTREGNIVKMVFRGGACGGTERQFISILPLYSTDGSSQYFGAYRPGLFCRALPPEEVV